jgi:hypothetical protein
VTGADVPAPGDYVVFTSDDGRVCRLVLARIEASGDPVAVLATFATLAGAQDRFEAEARSRAAHDRVRAFRRNEDGSHTSLRIQEPDTPS